MIKVYCNSFVEGKGHNFGDRLTAFIVGKLTNQTVVCLDVDRKLESDIIGCGSVLQSIPKEYNGYIWGSGFIRENSDNKFPNAKVLAVRGKLTRTKLFGNNSNLQLGDPGILCSLFEPKDIVKKYKFGVIPHYVDQQTPRVKELVSQGFKYINITDKVQDIINQICECEFIISSSLHGIIACDSLNIPNKWEEFSSNVIGNGFKFRDYYSSFEDKRELAQLKIELLNVFPYKAE